MRRRLFLALVPVVLIAVIAGVLFWRSNKANAEVGNLQIFKGSAEVLRSNTSEVGLTGSAIHLKDHIKAAPGSTVAIILKDNTIVRLEGGSEVEVTQLTYVNGKVKDAVFSLISGRMWSRVKPLSSGSNFDVETPTVTAAIRGTSFNTTFKNHITGVYVYHHTVNVTLHQTGSQKSVTQSLLLQMQQSSLQKDFNKGPQTPQNSFFDEWIRFNQAEDDRLCRLLHDIPDCESTFQKTSVRAATVSTPEIQPTPPTTPPVTVVPSTKKVGTPPTNTNSNNPAIIPNPVPVIHTETVNVLCSPVVETSYYQCHAFDVYDDQPTEVTDNLGTTWNLLAGNGELSASELGDVFYYPSYPGDTVQATYNGITGSSVPIVVADAVQSVVVDCLTVDLGDTFPSYDYQCTATANYLSGRQDNVTNNPNTTWSLASPDTGSLDPEVPGLYHPEYPDNTIQATFDSITGEFYVDDHNLG